MDPDENKVYTKRKQRQEQWNAMQTQPKSNPTAVKFPADGWSSSLQSLGMPLPSAREIRQRIRLF